MVIQTKTIIRTRTKSLQNRGVLFSSNRLPIASLSSGEIVDITNRLNFPKTVQTHTAETFKSQTHPVALHGLMLKKTARLA